MLLDLYVAWSEDPEQSIGVHMSPNAYSNGLVTPSGKSRYNARNIKSSTIEIVHRLHDLGLIGLEQGGPEELGKGYVTRIWAAEPLIEMFRDALFTYFDVGGLLEHVSEDRKHPVWCRGTEPFCSPLYYHLYYRRLRRQAKHEGIRAVQMKEWRTREDSNL